MPFIKNSYQDQLKRLKILNFKNKQKTTTTTKELRLTFPKEEILNEIIFVDSRLDSYKEVSDDQTFDKPLDKQHNSISVPIRKCTNKGLGLSVESVLQHQLVISEFSHLKGS